MSGMRKTGGILALIGGGIFLIGTLYDTSVAYYLFGISGLIDYISSLSIAAFAIVGGILVVTRDNSGNKLIHASWIMVLVITFLDFILEGWAMFNIRMYSVFTAIFPDLNSIGFPVEGIIILLGGIFLILSKD